MNMTLMKDRGPDVHEPKIKTVFGIILMHDKKDQQNPCSANLQAGVQETKYKITNEMTEAYKNACQMDVIKTHGEEEKRRHEVCRH